MVDQAFSSKRCRCKDGEAFESMASRDTTSVYYSNVLIEQRGVRSKFHNKKQSGLLVVCNKAHCCLQQGSLLSTTRLAFVHDVCLTSDSTRPAECTIQPSLTPISA
jgi:hypothetical protein